MLNQNSNFHVGWVVVVVDVGRVPLLLLLPLLDETDRALWDIACSVDVVVATLSSVFLGVREEWLTTLK